MDEEGAVENLTQKMEKRKKAKSKKGEKNEESSTMGIEEAQSMNTMKAIEDVQMSEKQDIAELKRHHKRDKGKKKKNKETKDAEAEIEKKGAREGELTGAHSEDGNGDAMGNAEKKKKREKNKNKNERFERGNTEEVEWNESGKWPEGESVSGKKSRKEAKKERKNQKAVRNQEDGDIEKEGGKDVEGNIQSTNCDGNVTKEHDRKKKKHKKKDTYKDDSSAAQQYSVDNDSNGLIDTDERHNNEVVYANKGKKKKIKLVENGSDEKGGNEVEHANKGKKKRSKSAENGYDDIRDNELESGSERKKKKTKLVENGSSDPTPNKSNKKVRFSGQVEVFPLPGDANTEKGNDEEENLVRGKRFTREEDEIVKEAVFKYIADHDLGDEGLNMVLNCSKHPQLKGCWKEIGSAIPYRPYAAVYYRAQVLFRRSENRKWTQEEYDEILKYQEEHGNQWRALADELGKHRWHVKDTWRRIKLTNRNKGNWSQSEYQKLFDLVNNDLQLKISEEKRSKHGMLRDNICWTAISDQLSTRSQATCCIKWYKQLTSPMVAEGVWADTDDYRLLSALYSLDATCMEDVDWDYLVDDRSGDVCRKRWSQMVLHIGKHGNKSFAEQVEVLAQRYCPHLLEAREVWDSKPRVP